MQKPATCVPVFWMRACPVPVNKIVQLIKPCHSSAFPPTTLTAPSIVFYTSFNVFAPYTMHCFQEESVKTRMPPSLSDVAPLSVQNSSIVKKSFLHLWNKSAIVQIAFHAILEADWLLLTIKQLFVFKILVLWKCSVYINRYSSPWLFGSTLSPNCNILTKAFWNMSALFNKFDSAEEHLGFDNLIILAATCLFLFTIITTAFNIPKKETVNPASFPQVAVGM